MQSSFENFGNPVWFVNIEVGTGQHWIRMAESIGTEVISEQRPKLEKSFMMAALRCLPRLYSGVCSVDPERFTGRYPSFSAFREAMKSSSFI